MANPFTIIARQRDFTWVSLLIRLTLMDFNYNSLFPEDISTFISHQALSVGTSVGYLIPSLHTSTAFIIGCHNARYQEATCLQIINLFSIFVGYPGTGKSPAIDLILIPMKSLDNVGHDAIISRTTCAGLIKQLDKCGKGQGSFRLK